MSDSEGSVDMNERNDAPPPRRRGRAPTPFRQTTGSVTVIESEDVDEPSCSGAHGHSKVDEGDSGDSSDNTDPAEEPVNVEEPGSPRLRQNLVVVLERNRGQHGNSSSSSSDEEMFDELMLEDATEDGAEDAAAVPRSRSPSRERDNAAAREPSPN